MFITLRDVSKGKPYSLNQSIESCKQIGIKTIFMWVGWYNIYEEQSWRWGPDQENSTEVKGALDNILKFYFWVNFIYHVKCNC